MRGRVEVGGGGKRLGACALAQHVPAAQSLLLAFLLQAVLQQPQLPLHRLLHGRLQLQHFLQVRLGLRLIPHLGVSPGPHIVGLHDACGEDPAVSAAWPGRQPSPDTRHAAGLHQLAQPLTLAMMTLNLSAPPEPGPSTIKYGGL